MSLPNLLSCSRYILAVLIFIALLVDQWAIAAVIFTMSVITDLGDGYLARRREQVSSLGGLLDHSADAVFVTAGLSALAYQDFVSPLLAPLVAAAFIQYALDSRTLSGISLRSSAIGRYNGISYYVLTGFTIAVVLLDLTPYLTVVINVCSYLLIAATLVSMADRLVTLIRLKRSSG